MGAIAVSKKEEEQIEKLRKELGIFSNSGLIRTALKTLKSRARKKSYDVRSRSPSAGAASRIARRLRSCLLLRCPCTAS